MRSAAGVRAVTFGITLAGASAFGCNAILGIGDVTSGAGGPDASPDAAACPPDTVCGTSTVTWLTATGAVPVPQDLTGTAISAYIPDGTAAGYTVVPGQITGIGTFRIANVPDATPSYFVKVVPPAGGTLFLATSLRVIDLDYRDEGRPDVSLLTNDVTLHFDLTGMSPWQNGDNLDLDAFNVGTELYGTEQAAKPPPRVGATATAFDLAWSRCYSNRADGKQGLVEAAKGDQILLAHAHNYTLLGTGGVTVAASRTVDSFTATDVTMTGPTPPGPIAGAFTGAGNAASITVNLDRPSFDAGYDDGLSNTTFFGNNFFVTTNPLEDLGVSLGPPVISAVPPTRATTVTIPYADAYPAAWQRTGSLNYPRLRFLRVPGATLPQFVRGGTNMQFKLSGPPPSKPSVTPPTGVTVDGADAIPGGRLAFDGTKAIHVAWSKVATADYYCVNAFHFYLQGAKTGKDTAGSVCTTATSVDLPPELFAAGFYGFNVDAIRDGGSYAAGHLRLAPFGIAAATTPSGRFRLSAHCGDGIVQTDEQCDPGANETAQCDLDCTTPVQGDGYRNALAGEPCDSSDFADSFTCDADGTPNVCGDGYRNTETEECDDGNTTDDGNGCTANCQRKGSCGDGTVQGAFEQCDPGAAGETAACNGDCTTSVCGDGWVNLAAGETCDPPGVNGCSPTCQ